MEKWISRTNYNVYNKMDKNTQIFMPKLHCYPWAFSTYIYAKGLAISDYEISDEIKNMDFMEILKRAATKSEISLPDQNSAPVLLKKLK